MGLKLKNNFMKKLLLSSILMLTSLISFAQADCASAEVITGNGTITSGAISGTYVLSCDQVNADTGTAPAAGNWYTYTPTTNGIVTVSSDLAANVAPNSTDTRISVWSGTCATLTCIGGADDISASNYLSTFTFNAIVGNTYYIQWDDRWDTAGFDFSFTFTPVSCFPVSIINVPTATTTTSTTLNWAASPSAPANYDVEYGPIGFVQGAGTTVSTPTNSISITGLTASTLYDFYVRSNCGATQSPWTTANTFTTAKVLPYASGFDNTTTQLAGWTTFGNGAYGLSALANGANAQSPSFYWIFNNTVGAASNNWLFTPAISLQAGETVSTTFWIRSGSARSLRLTVGTAATSVAQTTQIWANAALLATTYAQQTAPTWTAPTTGVYYFAFNDISASAAAVATMRLDTVNFTSVLGTNDFLSSNFSVYPNPVNNVINFSNTENAVVSSIEMTDMNGRVVKSVKVNATEGQVSVNDLATGIYMMKISTDQGVATKKIVKQ